LDNNAVGQVAFNYDRKESDMTMFTESDLLKFSNNTKIKLIDAALQANITGTISEKDKGIVLWKWFIIGALLFLALEALLLRFYKP